MVCPKCDKIVANNEEICPYCNMNFSYSSKKTNSKYNSIIWELIGFRNLFILSAIISGVIFFIFTFLFFSYDIFFGKYIIDELTYEKVFINILFVLHTLKPYVFFLFIISIVFYFKYPQNKMIRILNIISSSLLFVTLLLSLAIN